jgi:putative molybdopterin biosynthesis protein
VLTSLVRADGLLVVPSEWKAITPENRSGSSHCAGLSEIGRTIVAIGSHDLVLDLAASALRAADSLITLASSNVGSLGASWPCATACGTSPARICWTR